MIAIILSILALIFLADILNAQLAGYAQKLGNNSQLGIGLDYYFSVQHAIPHLQMNNEWEELVHLPETHITLVYSYHFHQSLIPVRVG
jgi:hypothetical protein